MKQAGYMDIVIAAARRAADAGEVPVAAAVVDPDGNIVAVAENRMQRDANATHHAEILALNAAMAAVDDRSHCRIKRQYFLSLIHISEPTRPD